MPYAKTYARKDVERACSILPIIWNYGEERYKGKNYGAHTIALRVSGIDFYYSYRTLVAVRGGGVLLIRDQDDQGNKWSQTTSKHISMIRRQVGGYSLVVTYSDLIARLFNMLRASKLIRAKYLPTYLQALETGEIINGEVDARKAKTYMRHLDRDVAKQKAKIEQRNKKALVKQRDKQRQQRKIERDMRQRVRKQQAKALCGFPAVELLEEML